VVALAAVTPATGSAGQSMKKESLKVKL